MSKEMKKTRVPKLRFPEFREAGGWEEKQLGELVNVRNGISPSRYDLADKGEYPFLKVEDLNNCAKYQTGSREYSNDSENTIPPLSVIFPKRGAAIQLNKVRINVSEVLMDTNLMAITPNDEIQVEFLFYKIVRDGLFKIADTSTIPQINNKHIIPHEIVIPSKPEQQKIAACLSSVDELVAAQSQKIEALKAHKKGLMQRLFPAEGERVPRVRFGKFEGEWEVGTLGEICKITSGGTPNRAEKEYWNGDIPWVTTTLIDFNFIEEANEYITEVGLQNSSAKIFPKNTILMAMYGQGKTRGKVAVLGIKAATNQACAAIILKDGFNTNFVFQNLASRYDEIRKLSNSGGQENLSAGLIESIPFAYPDIKTEEQQKIAACLSSIDDLITAQTQKLNALKAHKKGLMQQLFPSTNEENR